MVNDFLASLSHLSFVNGWGPNLARGLAATLQIAFGAYRLGLAIGLGGALGKLQAARRCAGCWRSTPR